MPRNDTTEATTTGNGKPARRRRRPPAPPTPQITLTGDRLIVRDPDEGERKTATGLLIPATAAPAPKRLAWGEVALTGPDVRVAKAGDRVLYLPSSGLEVELDGADYVLLRERDVQGVATADGPGTDRVSGQYL
jgi:chaperonin GroES